MMTASTVWSSCSNRFSSNSHKAGIDTDSLPLRSNSRSRLRCNPSQVLILEQIHGILELKAFHKLRDQRVGKMLASVPSDDSNQKRNGGGNKGKGGERTQRRAGATN